MANQHAKLGETHHLKNDARNQFGLFLKGIGAAACAMRMHRLHSHTACAPHVHRMCTACAHCSRAKQCGSTLVRPTHLDRTSIAAAKAAAPPHRQPLRSARVALYTPSGHSGALSSGAESERSAAMATPTMAAPTTAMAYTCHGHTRRLAMATHPQACLGHTRRLA